MAGQENTVKCLQYVTFLHVKKYKNEDKSYCDSLGADLTGCWTNLKKKKRSHIM